MITDQWKNCIDGLNSLSVTSHNPQAIETSIFWNKKKDTTLPVDCEKLPHMILKYNLK